MSADSYRGSDLREAKWPEIDRALKWGWSYHKTGWLFFRWHGTVGSWEPGFFAFTEKRLRRKMARFIKKQRRAEQTRRSSTRSSR